MQTQSQREKRGRGVKNRMHGLAVLQCAASNCGRERGREREGVVVYIEAGELIMGGMEECTVGGRETGGRGWAHGSASARETSPGSAN